MGNRGEQTGRSGGTPRIGPRGGDDGERLAGPISRDRRRGRTGAPRHCPPARPRHFRAADGGPHPAQLRGPHRRAGPAGGASGLCGPGERDAGRRRARPAARVGPVDGPARAPLRPRRRPGGPPPLDLRHRHRHQPARALDGRRRRRSGPRAPSGPGGAGAPHRRADPLLHRAGHPSRDAGRRARAARDLRRSAPRGHRRPPHPHPRSGRSPEGRVARRRPGRHRGGAAVRDRAARHGARRVAGRPPGGAAAPAADAARRLDRRARCGGARRRAGGAHHLRVGVRGTDGGRADPRLPRPLPPAGLRAGRGSGARVPRLAAPRARPFLRRADVRVGVAAPAAARAHHLHARIAPRDRPDRHLRARDAARPDGHADDAREG